jgi:hypothetical protein
MGREKVRRSPRTHDESNFLDKLDSRGLSSVNAARKGAIDALVDPWNAGPHPRGASLSICCSPCLPGGTICRWISASPKNLYLSPTVSTPRRVKTNGHLVAASNHRRCGYA